MRKSNKIKFIAAFEGGIELFGDNHEKLGYAKDPKELAKLIIKFKIADLCHGSSSMDFADEEGFATQDGAHILWEKALNVILNTKLLKDAA